MRSLLPMNRCGFPTWIGALLLSLFATSASAETLLMPDRAYLMGTQEVVWGITTQANGTAYTIDFGDGSAVVAGNITDRSYQTFLHTFPIAGTFTVTFTVNGEPATATVNVYDSTTLTTEQLRNLNINRTIQDGLRNFWATQANRANFNTTAETHWDGSPSSTSLVALAFENHGYPLPNSDATPVGIYPKYLVRRALNFVFNRLTPFGVSGLTPNGGDPCEAPIGDETAGAPVNCTLLYQGETQGYSTSIAISGIAGSGALNRHVVAADAPAVPFIHGRTYKDILERLVHGLGWGQNDIGTGRGGWNYGFNDGDKSDGSTIGWNMLALLDAEAGGVAVPTFVKPEFTNFAYARGKNTDGSYDYYANNNAALSDLPNAARAGIGLQAAFYTGDASGYPAAAMNYINNRWGGAALAGDYTATCFSSQNKSCGYAMFNIFKGLKLLGITTLSNVGRPAGPGAIPANDWYADYVDFLVTNQTAPQTTGGGGWNGGTNRNGGAATAVIWSNCCGHTSTRGSVLAQLILAPVALVLPDPTKFSTVGLKPFTSTGLNGTNHTVTAEALSTGNTPVPGATVNFLVLTGPNAGKNGTGTTDAAGKATFTYTDTVGNGTDEIQASIGALKSNIVTRTWVPEVIKCDADGDKDVDQADLALIFAANRKPANGANDPKDANGDGMVTVSDYRYCMTRLTVPN